MVHDYLTKEEEEKETEHDQGSISQRAKIDLNCQSILIAK